MGVNQIMGNMQHRIKSSSFGVFTILLKLVSGLVLGLTFALVGQEMIGYESLAFMFVMVVVLGVFLRIAKNWRVLGVVVFNVFLILAGMLLRVYIVIAPGA